MAARREGRPRLYRRLTISLLALFVSALPGCMSLLGLLPSFDEVGPRGPISAADLHETNLQILHGLLQGSTGYTLLEWTVVCLATAIAALAFVQSLARRDPVAPLVSMVAVFCASTALFHLLAFHGFSMEVKNLTGFVHFNWTLMQTGIALLLLLTGAVVLRHGDHQPFSTWQLVGFSSLLTVLAFVLILLTAGATEFGFFLSDLVPLSLFALCGIFLFPRLDRICKSHFSLALWASSIPLMASQIYMHFSTDLFDAEFLSAQIARGLAFAMLFGGLLWDYGVVHEDERDLKHRLTKTDRQTNLLVNNAIEAVIAFDEQGYISLWNPRAEQLFSVPSRDAEGRELLELLFVDDDNGNGPRGEFLDDLKRLTNDPDGFHPPTRRFVFKDASGARLLEYSLIGAQDVDEVIFALLVRDVSLREELQMRIIQMDRLAAVGTLAAGVVHEINNPLTYVITHLQLSNETIQEIQIHLNSCQDHFDVHAADPLLEPMRLALQETRGHLKDLRLSLETADEGAWRVKQILQDMRFFSRVAPDEVTPIRVEEALDVAIRMTRGEICGRATLDVEIPQNLPRIRAEATRLSQVFVNLLINAAHAINQVPDKEHTLSVRARVRGDDLEILFRDTGPGMSRALQKRIFTPFFTTKPSDTGTGLGLSLSRRIVEEIGGTIDVESAPGEGSTFRIRLPLLQDDT